MVKKDQEPSFRRQKLPNFQQEPTTLKSNRDFMFSRKANSLSLTQTENYSFGASFDKISSNDKENLPITIFKFIRGLNTSPKKFIW